MVGLIKLTILSQLTTHHFEGGRIGRGGSPAGGSDISEIRAARSRKGPLKDPSSPPESACAAGL